jgi:hypothetical protein
MALVLVDLNRSRERSHLAIVTWSCGQPSGKLVTTAATPMSPTSRAGSAITSTTGAVYPTSFSRRGDTPLGIRTAELVFPEHEPRPQPPRSRDRAAARLRWSRRTCRFSARCRFGRDGSGRTGRRSPQTPTGMDAKSWSNRVRFRRALPRSAASERKVVSRALLRLIQGVQISKLGRASGQGRARRLSQGQ